MEHLVVIGIGNTLRGDDGAGFAVAEEFAREAPPEVRCLAVHQLLPEHAELVARASRVVFVDAATNVAPGRLRVSAVEGRPASGQPLGHHASPSQVVALAQALYGAAPHATLISIGANHFEAGEPPQPAVRAAAARALGHLRAATRKGNARA